MVKRVNIPFDNQTRKTIRMVAGFLDETASDLIRDAVRDKLEKMQLPISEDPNDEK